MRHSTVTLFIILLLLILSSPTQAAPPTTLDDALATLEPVQGLIQVQTPDSDTWTTVVEPMLVGEGYRIRANGQGLAYLTYFDGAETQILPNTLVVVSTMVMSESGDINVSLDVLVGSTFTNIDTALDAGDRFEIHTPSATAAVRGTEWWTMVDPDGTAWFDTVDGVVEILPHPSSVAESSGGSASAPSEDEENIAPEAASEAELMFESAMSMEPGMQMVADVYGYAESAEFSLPALPPSAPLAPLTCGDGICGADETDLCALDCGADLPTCGNGICDLDQGEDLLLCGEDCGPWSGMSCGDSYCDADESDLTCPSDCDQYFEPVVDELCGNGICDPTESGLTCAADCHPAISPACTVTAPSANLRTGPGLDYPVGAILSGESLLVVGQLGGWYVVEHPERRYWVAVEIVQSSGSCSDLPEVSAPASAPTSHASGTWGACGSCDSCGYPASECVLSPEGQCLWDPSTCHTTTLSAPVDPAAVAGTLTLSGCPLTCLSGGFVWATAAFAHANPAVSVANSASTSSDPGAVGTWINTTSSKTFDVKANCTGPAGSSSTLTVTMFDTQGLSYTGICTVTIMP